MIFDYINIILKMAAVGKTKIKADFHSIVQNIIANIK